ncbi:porin gram-negative type (plasmid) [Cupriavidus necator N-1]|uniref:Porin gram-negative type n=1 Tax=Cupriavidus necator (strain ATCC 43291 / DSM 13513 / CCUG 52238 / LMG 8453 / N-1) TaxID=1042878 RepID=F8GYK8_CUPNN
MGLENQWDRVTLGWQQNALFDLLINYEPMVLAARYSAMPIDANFAGRYDNTAKHTGKFGPVTATALFRLPAASPSPARAAPPRMAPRYPKTSRAIERSARAWSTPTAIRRHREL